MLSPRSFPQKDIRNGGNMGGKICVGIRHTLNGAPEEVFLFWHTNPLSPLLMTRDFLLQGETLRTFIKQAKPENHWDDGQRIDKPKLPNDSYGIVLVDFVTKRIFSQNHYSSYGEMVFGILYANEQNSRLSCVMDLLEHGLLDDTIESLDQRSSRISLETFRTQLPFVLAKVKKRNEDREKRMQQMIKLINDLDLVLNDDQATANKKIRHWTKARRLKKLFRKERIYCEEDLSIEQPLMAPLLTASLSPKFFARDLVHAKPHSFKEVRAWAQAQGWKTPFGRSKHSQIAIP